MDRVQKTGVSRVAIPFGLGFSITVHPSAWKIPPLLELLTWSWQV